MRRPRPAFTLLETLCTLSVVAILLAVALPRVRQTLDHAAARGALNDADALLASARQIAIGRGTRATVTLDPAGVFTLTAATDTLRRRDVRALYGVETRASRTTVTYTPLGLALASSNLTLIVSRGAAAETLTISRLGRVRR